MLVLEKIVEPVLDLIKVARYKLDNNEKKIQKCDSEKNLKLKFV